MSATTKENIDAAISTLIHCEGYLRSQKQLGKSLSDGIFRLTKARKSSTSVRSVDDARFDLNASLTVGLESTTTSIRPTTITATLAEDHANTGNSIPINDEDHNVLAEFECYRAKNSAIYAVCGMPPPALRHAQGDFEQAVDQVVKMANIARSLIAAMNNISLKRES